MLLKSSLLLLLFIPWTMTLASEDDSVAIASDTTYYTAEEDTHPKYSFNYKVKDSKYGNDFGHTETRDGDYTSGSYYVLLPDGRVQTVKYTADEYNGFKAKVTYSGTAKSDYSLSKSSSSKPGPPPIPYNRVRVGKAVPVSTAAVYSKPIQSILKPKPTGYLSAIDLVGRQSKKLKL